MSKILSRYFGLFVALIASSALSAQGDFVENELIIMFKKNIDANSWLKTSERSNSIKSAILSSSSVSRELNTFIVKVDPAVSSLQELSTELLKFPEILFVQKNHYVQQREVVPNDTFLLQQWQWVNKGLNGGKLDADVDAELAWDITTGGLTASGDTIVVAVVDDGASLNHPDLKENWWKNYGEIPGNAIDDDGNGYIDDFNGWNVSAKTDNVSGGSHGVSVAGMIGAKGNNKTGVTGINWNVKIMPVKYKTPITEASVIESYSYVLQQRLLYNESNGTKGAFVVSCNSSWGIDKGNPNNSPIWCAFYDTMGVHGILSVGATANANFDIDAVGDLPTACPSDYLIAVTSSTRTDTKATAGYGITTIDLAAPGNQIYTTSAGAYTTTSGTSFASPLVSGLVGLLYSAPCSNLANLSKRSPAEAAKLVRNSIFDGVDNLPTFASILKYGGRANAFNSLRALDEYCGTCPKPIEPTVSAIIDTTATMAWIAVLEDQKFDVIIKSLNQADWDTIRNVNSPLSLTNLTSCTEYEYKIRPVCADTSNGFGLSLRFKTDGCCVAPTGIQVVSRNDSTLLFSWGKVLAAQAYKLTLKNLKTGKVVEKDLNATTLEITNLTPCTEFEYWVGIQCKDSSSIASSSLKIKTAGCGACEDRPYCVTVGGATNVEYIDSVVLNTLVSASGDNGGYKYFDNVTTNLNWLSKYTISVTPGFQSTNSGKEMIRAWIDFNQDGVFSNNERVLDPKVGTQTTISKEFVVPKGAVPGITRLRIVMRFTTDTTITACAPSFTYGEVEDYCVNIVPTVICQTIANVKIGKTAQNTELLTWDSEITADRYVIEYKRASETLWSTLYSTKNSFEFLTLDTCEDYNVRVRSDCNGQLTDFTTVLNFKTLCTNSTSDLDNNSFQYLINPNPFDDQLVIGLRNWSKGYKFMLYDLSGRMVYSALIDNGSENYVIDTKDYSSGIYIAKLLVGNNLVTKKIVKD